MTLADAACNGGRYFGTRIGRYIPQPTDPRRLAAGLGVIGLALAALNYGAGRVASERAWLRYDTFGEIMLAMILGTLAVRYARRG